MNRVFGVFYVEGSLDADLPSQPSDVKARSILTGPMFQMTNQFTFIALQPVPTYAACGNRGEQV